MPRKYWTVFFQIFTYRHSRALSLIRRYITSEAGREYAKNQSVLTSDTSNPVCMWYKALELRWAIERLSQPPFFIFFKNIMTRKPADLRPSVLLLLSQSKVCLVSRIVATLPRASLSERTQL
jgi:hypothetical protein